MKDLLRTADLSRDDVELLLNTAADFAKNPLRSKDALAHKSVAIYMTKPSTRTHFQMFRGSLASRLTIESGDHHQLKH